MAADPRAALTGLIEIGRGGSAVAFAGVDPAGRAVVLKLFHVAADPRAAREAELLAAVPAEIAPAVFELGQVDDGRPYLVLERIGGRALADLGSLGIAGRMSALAAVAQSIDRLHASGVVHRDLKPAHLFWRDDRPAAIIDFALASRSLSRPPPSAPLRSAAGPGRPQAQRPSDGDVAPERVGTPYTMSPEQCRGAADIGPAADLYALGVIAFELLTGRRPFEGSAAEIRSAHVSSRPPRASAFAPLPTAVDDVFARCLAKDPTHRPGSAADLVGELEAALRAPVAADSSEATITPIATPAPEWRPTAVIAFAASDNVLDVERAAVGEATLLHTDGARFVLALPPSQTVPASVASAARLAGRLPERLSIEGPIAIAVADVRPRPTGAGWRARRGAAILDELAGAPDGGDIVFAPSARQAGAALGERDLDRGYTALAPPRSLVAAAPLRGRAELVNELRGAAIAGSGVAIVFGDPGSGKTRVLAELAAALRDAGIELIAGDAGPDLLDQLVEAASGRTGHADTALGLDDAREPGRSRVDAARALAAMIDRAAGNRRLAILIDDVHRADPIAIDALEQAVERPGSSVWLCVAGAASFRDSRPGFAGGAPAAIERHLPPLSNTDSRALLRDLLAPIEFIPEAVIERLAAGAAGSPLFLVELAHALAAGARAELPVAADQLVHRSAVPVAGRGAERALARMSLPLRELCLLCAVLGDVIDPGEVDRAQRQAGGDWIDARVGIDRLVRAGVVVEDARGRFRFRHPIVRQAIESVAAPGDVERLHRAALDIAGGDHARIAIHAEAAGLRERALAAHMAVAERARRRHAFVDAELAYSSALGCASSDADRMRALSGRGQVRYQSQRFDDALADIGAARAVAERLGRDRDVIELCLIEAMILDWTLDLRASAERTAAARQLAGDRAGELEPALLAAEGRVAYRAEDLALAVDRLTRAADAGDRHTRTIALLLLAPSLLFLDRVDEAERRYREVVDECEAAGDEFHLATAFCNRPLLWMRRRQLDRAIGDLERAVALARRHGNALLERFSSHNLAEILYWSGDPGAALPLAARSMELMLRFSGGHDLPDDALLMARIHAAGGDLDTSRAMRDSVDRSNLAPTAAALARLLDLILDPGEPAAWDALDRDARALGSELSLEICLWAARSRRAAGDPAGALAWADRARVRGGDVAPWAAQLAASSQPL